MGPKFSIPKKQLLNVQIYQFFKNLFLKNIQNSLHRKKIFNSIFINNVRKKKIGNLLKKLWRTTEK